MPGDDWSDDEQPTKKPAPQKSSNDDDWGDSKPSAFATRGPPKIARGGFAGSSRPRQERSEGDYKETVRIEGSKSGKIIGAQGAIINEMKEEFQVQINVPKETDDDGMKDVEVTGEESNVKSCIRRIQQKVGGERGERPPAREANENDYTGSISIEAKFGGRIIGRGGEVINELKSTYNVEINVPKEADEDDKKLVEVTGDESNVKECLKAIEEKISGSGGRGERPPREDNYDSYGGDDDKYKEKFEIPLGMVGRIVGSKGATISELQSEFNVKINISKDDTGDEQREVEVIGDESDVKKGVAAIKDKIKGGSTADGDNKPRETYVPPTPTENEDEMFSNGIETGINFDKFDDIEVRLTGENASSFVAAKTFESLKLRETLMENIQKCKYTKPTPIQKHAIPVIMGKRDLMGCAQTGSGKTAAFALPILQRIMDDQESPSIGQPQALVVAPTRELAIQIFEEFRKFANRSYIKVCIAYGGAFSRHQQDNIAKGCHVLVATPGRLIDYIDKGVVSFQSLKFLVLDEADRMLDMGFQDNIKKIATHPTRCEDVQTLMFSATFPEEIQGLASQYLRNYVFLTVGTVGGASTDVEQEIVEVEKHKKRHKLTDILDVYCKSSEEDRILVFVETKKTADFLASLLSETKISSTSIHGDRLQSERETALREFRSGKRKVLIATSVAARGLDIKGVTHVINYDLPTDIQDYVHRIGRTGRVGNRGKATSFYDPTKDSGVAAALAGILKGANQPVPEFLGHSGEGYEDGQGNFGGEDVRKGVTSGKKQETNDDEW